MSDEAKHDGMLQHSKNVSFILYIRHTMVDCKEAAAVVTKSAKLNAAQFLDWSVAKQSVLHTQGSEKPYSATSCPVSMLMEALPLDHTPLLNLALDHNLLLHIAAGKHYQLIGVALWNKPPYPWDGRETTLGRLTVAQTIFATSNAKLPRSVTWEILPAPPLMVHFKFCYCYSDLATVIGTSLPPILGPVMDHSRYFTAQTPY